MSVAGDLFQIQVRVVGEASWSLAHDSAQMFDSVVAASSVRQMNTLAHGCVYRAVLVAYA